MIFRNGRLIFPDAIRDGLELVVRDGKITEIRESSRVSESDVIDLHGNFLAPGFIDLHLHGGVGRDTMEASSEAFRAICDHHATGGTTSLLLTTVTAPMDEIVSVLQTVKELHPMKQILGVHVEGPFISKAKRGAQREEFITEPTSELIGELLQFSDVIKIVTLAPELRGALNLVDQLRERNICVSGGHSDAWDDEARAAFEHGMRQITHAFNCMSSAQRRGIYRTAGLLEFALSEPEILCELIADGHHVSATLMKMLYCAKDAGGICLVTDATAGAGLPEGSRFSIGGRECIVSDGVCLLADRSALSGSASRMIDLVRTMVQKVDVPLHEAIRMATENPARSLGLEGKKGCLAPSADADFAVLSSKLEVVRTFFRGRQIFPQSGSGGL
jgi:N-acetylglucosamine-6-phosphate deacetylase